MKKVLILICVATFSVFSQTIFTGSSVAGDNFSKVGSAGAQFLKIGPGARANAMGGAYVSVADDLSSIHWNPAGVADIDDISIYSAYTSWFADFQQSFVAVAAPISNDFRVSAYFSSFGVNDIPFTTFYNQDGQGAVYSVNDYIFGLGFHGYLTKQFSFGINAKYVLNAFQTASAGGFAFDIGTKYDTKISGIKIGFSIHNLSAERAYEGSNLQTQTNNVYVRGGEDGLNDAALGVLIPAVPFSLPIIFRAGLSKEIFEIEDHSLLVAADFITMTDAPEQFALGVDYSWRDILSLRGGYYIGNDQLGLTGGVGANYDSGDFDGTFEIAFNPTQSFGLVTRLNLILNFKD